VRSIVVSIGHKAPAWVHTAAEDYARRLPRDWEISWRALRAEPRHAAASAGVCMEREAQRIDAALRAQPCHRVALDTRGCAIDSLTFARQCGVWHDQGVVPAFVIGGADGLHPRIREEAALVLQLSHFTLPHDMVRVVLAEQIFRAWSILHQHPYHRD